MARLLDTCSRGWECFFADNDVDKRPLRYDGMNIDIAEIGLFFAYPWAEEQTLIQALFDAVAAEGAILVSYHHAKKVCVFRKAVENNHGSVSGRKSRSRTATNAGAD